MTLQTTIFWIKNLSRIGALLQYRESLKNERLSLEELSDLEWRKQKSIVEYAYKHCGFYKRYYDEIGFCPSDLKEKEDWALVPVLEKKDVRDFFKEIISDEATTSIMRESMTGGSTGRPLRIYHDKRHHFEVLGWRSLRWWGASPGESLGSIHRKVPKSRLEKIKNKLIWWPTYRTFLDASMINEKELSLFVEDIVKHNVNRIHGYVGSLEKVADYIINNDIQITSVKSVWSTSAPLLYNVREKIEKAFHCKVMNQYGCNEIYHIATQCPHSDHLHIHSDFVHLDVVDESNHLLIDKDGDILVTDLKNRVFPLVKYRLGDRGRLLSERCFCGISLPLLEDIKGRISDAIITPSGRYLDGVYLTSIFDDFYKYVDQFQIRQLSDYSVVVYIKFKNQDNIRNRFVIDSILSNLRKNTNNEISVKTKIVDYINDDKGKIRYIISDIVNQMKSK